MNAFARLSAYLVHSTDDEERTAIASSVSRRPTNAKMAAQEEACERVTKNPARIGDQIGETVKKLFAQRKGQR